MNIRRDLLEFDDTSDEDSAEHELVFGAASHAARGTEVPNWKKNAPAGFEQQMSRKRAHGQQPQLD